MNICTALSDQEMLQYSRQIMLPSFDLEGQERLSQARVLVVGLGGLGCTVAHFLASSGVGQLTLQDLDCVESSNLPRQILHRPSSIGQAKVDSARHSLQAIAPNVAIKTYSKPFVGGQDVTKFDCVVDCTDNLVTRQAINSACYQAQVPLVCGAVIRLEGQLGSFYTQQDSACYACVSSHFSAPEVSCSEAGVLSPMVGVIGSMQATEVLKIISKCASPLHNQWVLFDGATMQSRIFNVARNPHCEVCSH